MKSTYIYKLITAVLTLITSICIFLLVLEYVRSPEIKVVESVVESTVIPTVPIDIPINAVISKKVEIENYSTDKFVRPLYSIDLNQQYSVIGFSRLLNGEKETFSDRAILDIQFKKNKDNIFFRLNETIGKIQFSSSYKDKDYEIYNTQMEIEDLMDDFEAQLEILRKTDFVKIGENEFIKKKYEIDTLSSGPTGVFTYKYGIKVTDIKNNNDKFVIFQVSQDNQAEMEMILKDFKIK